ncbi:STAS domain-containing protein [Nonomuraea sp. NPDC049152]|uniref:STAS domain-containing protein n=1 Tax=Nonomuraea sp. NPDC049152 TaxID=3154350 RepID=UPI0033F0027C
MTSALLAPTATVVHLRGVIDIFSSNALRQRLLRLLPTSEGTLICDLSCASFDDVSGLGVLVGARRRARSMGILLALAAPNPYTAELLRTTGLGPGFLIYE